MGCRRKAEERGALLSHRHALPGVRSFASPRGGCVKVVKPLPWVIPLAENLAVVETFLGLYLERNKS